MALPQRSLSQTVRVPRFLRSSTTARPAQFGRAPEVIPPPPSAQRAMTPRPSPAPSPPLITMPANPELPPSEDVPSELLETDDVAALDAQDSDAFAGASDAIAAEETGEDQDASSAADAPPSEIPAQVVDEMQTAVAEIAEAARRDALALGLALARRLVGLYITADEAALRKVIDEAFQKLSGASHVEVHLNPEDLAMVQRRDQLQVEDSENLEAEDAPPANPFAAPDSQTDVHLVADPSLGRGETRVKSDVGEVDATLESRMAIALAVLGEIE